MPTGTAAPSSSSSSSSSTSRGDDDNNEKSTISKLDNAAVLRALNKLTEHIKHDPACIRDPPHLSHYRQPFPSDVTTAYDLLRQGAQVVHSTSTKYTLIGKTHPEEQAKVLPKDLLQGCELIGAASHILFQDASGCSRAVRRATQRACLSILINVTNLVSVFEDKSAVGGGSANTIGAQKTGAVWQSCDQILNTQRGTTDFLMPQGNRNAIRREMFTWTRECQDSMDEFQEIIDAGPRPSEALTEEEDTAENDDDDDDNDDDFFGDDDENRYSDSEFPIAISTLALLKNSRGNMKIALEICEFLGTRVSENVDDDKQRFLDMIQQVHRHARIVGESVTDLGSLMYPPLLPNCRDLVAQVQKQVRSIQEFQSYIQGLNDGDGVNLPNNITEFSNILKNACESRESEFIDSVRIAGGNA